MFAHPDFMNLLHKHAKTRKNETGGGGKSGLDVSGLYAKQS